MTSHCKELIVSVCTAFQINFQQANNVATHCCVHSGDPRRPYPQDIEMRSGWLGRLMEGVSSETDQPVTGASSVQKLTQPSVSTSHVSQSVGGLGRFNNNFIKLIRLKYLMFFLSTYCFVIQYPHQIMDKYPRIFPGYVPNVA